jgi:hypothetical protein
MPPQYVQSARNPVLCVIYWNISLNIYTSTCSARNIYKIWKHFRSFSPMLHNFWRSTLIMHNKARQSLRSPSNNISFNPSPDFEIRVAFRSCDRPSGGVHHSLTFLTWKGSHADQSVRPHIEILGRKFCGLAAVDSDALRLTESFLNSTYPSLSMANWMAVGAPNLETSGQNSGISSVFINNHTSGGFPLLYHEKEAFPSSIFHASSTDSSYLGSPCIISGSRRIRS